MRRSSIRGTGQAFAIDKMAFASLPGRSLLEKHSKVLYSAAKSGQLAMMLFAALNRIDRLRYILSSFTSGSSGSLPRVFSPPPSSVSRSYGDRMECVSANVFVVPLNHHLL